MASTRHRPPLSSDARGGWFRLALALVLITGLAGSVQAGEPFARFLDGLRARGLHEAALDYLEQMRTSKLLPPGAAEKLDYEQARTLLEAARVEQDPPAQARYLEASREAFERFIKEHPADELASRAALELGNVTLERGRIAADGAARTSDVRQRDALVAEARARFTEARGVFTEAATRLAEQLKALPASTQAAVRDRLRSDVVQSELYAASAAFEAGKTWPTASPDGKKTLEDAAKQCEQIFQAHRTHVAGLVARILQGQCYQALGDRRRATEAYANVLAQGDEIEDVRRQKARALALSLECWTTPGEARAEQAAEKGDVWLAKTPGLDDRQADVLAIRYYTALAHKQLADKLPPQDGPRRARETNIARGLAERVARQSGALQGSAKTLLRQLGVVGAHKEPATFAEAVEQGKAAMEEMAAKTSMLQVSGEIPNAPPRAEIERQLAAAQGNARRLFRAALALRDKSTPIDEVNSVRYYLCYLDFRSARYYDAAILGELLAYHYPKSAGARPAAKIALAAYLEAYKDGIGDRSIDRQRMAAVAKFISDQWPKEPEAQDAWSTLLAVNIGENRLDEAAACLDKIADQSIERADAELKLGQAWWREYLLDQRKEGESRPPQSQLDAQADRAQQFLERGLARAREILTKDATIRPEWPTAALALAQIYVGREHAAQAVELLEEPRLGPLVLVQSGHVVARDPEFAVEACKIGLRAYVATQALDKAEAMMNQLDKLAAARGEGGQAELTRIYISLGRGLEEEVAALRNAQKPAEMQKVAKAFEKFLERIGQRQGGNTFSSLNWVAQTFSGLGSGYDVPSRPAPAEARAYFEKSLATDRLIIANAERDKKFLPVPEALYTVEVRAAHSLRRSGKPKEALDLLESVLTARPQLLDAQIEAAGTYMDWGREKDVAYYSLAILGARKPKDLSKPQVNIFWGWAKIAQIVQLDKNYQGVYHEARLNAARARLYQAEARGGSEKTDALKRATYEIFITYRTRPDLGGPEYRPQYDQLLKTIQKLLGEKPVGLKAFERGTPSEVSAK